MRCCFRYSSSSTGVAAVPQPLSRHLACSSRHAESCSLWLPLADASQLCDAPRRGRFASLPWRTLEMRDNRYDDAFRQFLRSFSMTLCCCSGCSCQNARRAFSSMRWRCRKRLASWEGAPPDPPLSAVACSELAELPPEHSSQPAVASAAPNGASRLGRPPASADASVCGCPAPSPARLPSWPLHARVTRDRRYAEVLRHLLKSLLMTCRCRSGSSSRRARDACSSMP
mmetsp:Transcript_57631/g.185134  ORF Transcript_57631/g.185134 Transcript_57631/m.185134 type:complete len:228 (+) Transcript_57631:776-1459(+)